MSGTTANYGFRIPNVDGSDYQVPDDIRVPITQIDAQIKRIDNKIGALDANGWLAGVLGTTTTTWRNGPNTTVSSVRYKRQLDIVAVSINFNVKAAMTAGNLNNTVICYVPTSLIPVYANGNFNTGANGSSFSASIGVDGGIVMSNLDNSIPANNSENCYGMYMM